VLFFPPDHHFSARTAPSRQLPIDRVESGVGLSEIDRNLLERCIQRKPRAWEDFVDRFLGLVLHVINHTAQARSIRLLPEDRDDLCAEVFLNIIKDDFGLLRHFRGQSSLATYLTVVARRIVVRNLLQSKTAARLTEGAPVAQDLPDHATPAEERIGNADEVERLMEGLDVTEAKIVRMYHLNGSSYQEISSVVGMPENSIGPILSRARAKMRETRVGER
jgi:RNA polymerase sigma-70 factor (ECF subfamily)